MPKFCKDYGYQVRENSNRLSTLSKTCCRRHARRFSAGEKRLFLTEILNATDKIISLSLHCIAVIALRT